MEKITLCFLLWDEYDYSDWNTLKYSVEDTKYLASELSKSFNFDTVVYYNSTLEEIYEVLQEYKNKKVPENSQLFSLL